MPEWKSFSMGDGTSPLTESPIQHLSQTATPAPGMEADAAAEKWGTDVSEVSIERIENVVAGDGLSHGANEFVVITDVEGARIQIHREPADSPLIQIEARMKLDAERAAQLDMPRLNELTNKWNVDHLQPTTFALETEDGKVVILATRFFAGKGMSDRQIHAMVRRGLGVTLQALNEMPALLAPA